MLYHLLFELREQISLFNVVRYITFRTAMATLSALLIVLLFGPWTIERLRRLKFGQQIRGDGPETHKVKAGTPTMGGILIVAGAIVPTLLWGDLTNRNVWMLVFATLAFGGIGFADDYIKIAKKRSLGLTARQKLAWQFTVAIAIGASLYFASIVDPESFSTRVVFPFFKRLQPELGVFYIAFAAILLVGYTNAVNLTDGLDGLAIGATFISSAALTALAYVTGHRIFANYLDLLFQPSAGEVTVFCGALTGAAMGFLWWNCYPAQVFMGDVGSLALGGALGTIAILIKQELLLIPIGGLFVIEALSVIGQVASFKFTGKRIFRMAPLHHHFELIGWRETQVVIRFWIVAFIFALMSLATVKLR
jgi:phospho-N-acetylmuramoyl-pentapeptide-transferase